MTKQVGIEGHYKQHPGFIGGARIVRSPHGLIVGHVTRSYKAYTGTVRGWRFIPAGDWTGLSERYFTASQGAAKMEREVLTLAAQAGAL